jgi:hypothetical protein
MTTPTIIFFGYDFEPKVTPKIFLRTLLYSTATQGQIVEGMFVKVRCGNFERIFSFWGYSETNQLTAGSGLQVSRAGFSANHHFVLSVHEEEYSFDAGLYVITVFARVVGKRKPVKLSDISVTLDENLAGSLSRHEGVLFERNVDGNYEGHTQSTARSHR